MKILGKINNWIYNVTGVASAICLLGIVIFTFAQVLSRYVFHYSIKWSSELIIYLLTWMVYMGCSMGYKKGTIVGLVVAIDRLGPVMKTISYILSNLLLLFFFVFSVVVNHEVVRDAANKFSTIMHLKLSYVSGSWSVVGSIMSLYAIEKIGNNILSLKKKGDADK